MKISLKSISVILLSLLLSLIVFRKFILVNIASFLIDTDPIEKIEYACVLSGNAKNRANKAAELYHQGHIKKIICTGNNLHFISSLLDTEIIEPKITKAALEMYGVPDSAIKIVNHGTSTKEEIDLLAKFCVTNDINELMIITSAFHTRRVRYTSQKIFEDANVKVNLQGAANKYYNQNNWWTLEGGLIACNNEWIKYLFYLYIY